MDCLGQERWLSEQPKDIRVWGNGQTRTSMCPPYPEPIQTDLSSRIHMVA